MNVLTRRLLFLLVMLTLTTPRLLLAQAVTTGTISGVVHDPQGALLPGASIVATHEPTGTKYETVTGGEGQFQILNVRVGGPYSVTATLGGFKDQTERIDTVGLGENKTVEFKLPLANVSETVTVTAEAPVIDPTRAGTATNVRSETIENLPTIARSLFDFARTSPLVNATADSAGNDTYISIAGRNNRYNNMQIDGAVNNDVFGIPTNGTPGGQAGTQPISLDAVQEIQVAVSPYDVRQGGFSGGNVNVVTKSGTNTFSGTGYWYQRDQNLVGKIPALTSAALPNALDTKVGLFKDKQAGFSVGGPIAHDRAFFFSNFDFGRKTVPSGFSADGTTGQPWAPADLPLVQQVINIAKNTYGYDPGGLAEVSQPTNNNKTFIRTDYNLGQRTQLTARMNYIDATRLQGTNGIPSTQVYDLPNDFYNFHDKSLGLVSQLNSNFSHAYNEFRVAYNRIRDNRDIPTPVFPYVRVDFPDANNVRIGSENSSHANALNQDIVELTDDFTLVRGTHTFTIGTHNEFFKFYNLFLANLFGQYRFSSPAAFQAGIAQFYTVSFSNSGTDAFAARFSVQQFGAYAGDQWRVRPNLTLTYGIRFDVPHFPDDPSNNLAARASFGYDTTVVPAPKMWSPRIGFNWDTTNGTGRSQVRGGIGMFTGRTPYVWLSNQYGNTGVDVTSLSTSDTPANQIPFVADPRNQPRAVAGGSPATPTVNFIDPNYKYPESLRGNLGYDRELPFLGLIATADYVYTKTIKDVSYTNVNYIPSGTTLPDGRTLYAKKDNAFADAILLSNTNKGSSWNLAFKLERPFKNGFNFSGSYLYGRAYSVNDGTSSIAASNWANNPAGLTLDPTLTRSVYDPGNRVNFTAVVPIPLTHGFRSTASVFYNGQSGRPYNIMFTGNPNNDNRSNNDIAFVPSSCDQVILLNGTCDQLMSFINSTSATKDYLGAIPPRSAGRAPWQNEVDFRYAVTLPTGTKAHVDLTMDVLNLMNLFNKKWGWQMYPLFPSSSANGFIIYSTAAGAQATGTSGVDSATNKMRYNLSPITNPNYTGVFQRDDTRSRWQAQWGIRVRF